MNPRARKPYGTGELRIGSSSWNYEEQSVKWVYHDRRGGISLRSPETPVDVLVEMLLFAYEENLLDPASVQKIKKILK